MLSKIYTKNISLHKLICYYHGRGLRWWCSQCWKA